MASVARSFPPPTAAPLALYTPGLTGIDSALPTHSAAFGWALQRVLSLTTTASTIGFKWLSLDNLSRRPLDLPATPTSNYCLQPTTIITTGNFSLAISVIPAFVFLVSLLFGAGMVHFGRRRGSSISPFTVSRLKVKYAKSLPKSLHTDSPTLFHQGASVLSIGSYIPRLSSLRICALSFVLRGLAFLFHLIRMEKLLDMVEHNAADHKAAAGTVNHIAELRVLNRRLGHAAIFSTTQTAMSPARLPDANKTVVAPFTPAHAKSKLERVFLPSSADKVDVILLPEEVMSPFKKIHLASGNRLSTPPRDNADVSRSVEPSGVPERSLAEPRAESCAQAELRRIFQRCLEESPQRPRYSKPLSATPSVASKPRSASVIRAEVQRTFRPCFDDSLQLATSKSTALPSSVRPLDPTLEIDTSHHKNPSFKQEETEECPKTPQKNVTVLHPVSQDFQLQLPRDRSTIDAKENHVSALQTDFGQDEPTQQKSERDRSLSRFSHRGAGLGSLNSEGIPNHTIHDGMVRDSERDAIAVDPSQRSRVEAAEATSATVVSESTKHSRESQPDEQPRQPSLKSRGTGPKTDQETPRVKVQEMMAQIRQRHEDLVTRVQAALKRCDERRELRAKAFKLGHSQDVGKEVPSTALSTPPCEHRSLTTSGEWDPVARLHSLLELVVPLSDVSDDQSATTIDQTSWSFEGYVRPPAEPVEPSCQRLEDHIPVATC